jgi:hypothetical protein
MTWLQGPHAGVRPTELVAGSGGVAAPSVVSAVAPLVDVTLDHVGGIAGAATVIAALHAGEKRLVFCETRRAAEALALELRERGVQTFVSHSSLSRDERRQSEQAFAEARDCVIVATSTLELGVDVGDLDRMIQIDSPRTVASFLQRLGRTGRRADTHRKALLLTTRPDSLLQAAALLLLWSRGFVESITAPPQPLHIAAQQILAICLERRVTRSELLERWGVHALAGGRAASCWRAWNPTGTSPATARRSSSGPRPSGSSAVGTSWNCSVCSPPPPSSPLTMGGKNSAPSTRSCSPAKWKVRVSWCWPAAVGGSRTSTGAGIAAMWRNGIKALRCGGAETRHHCPSSCAGRSATWCSASTRR